MKTPPLAHQQDFLNWAKGRSKIPLLSEQGTGKTWMALAWLEKVMAHGSGHIAILCETGFIDTWVEEINRFTDLPVVGVKGSLNKKIQYLLSPHTIKVIGYDALASSLSVQLRKMPWSVCIADESTNLKRIKAKQTKMAIKIFKGVPYKMIMTGTPITNTLFDVWSQFMFLDEGATFGPSFWDFRNKYFRPWGFEWKPKPTTFTKFQELLGTTSFRYLKKDCLDLPNKIKKRIPVELDPKGQKIYDDLVKDWLSTLDDGSVIESKYVVQKMCQFAQICSGWINGIKIPSTKRDMLETVLRDIKDRSKGIVIWCRFINEVMDVVEICEKLKLPGVTFTGTDSAKEIVNDFQNDPKQRVFITTIKKAAKGITLTKASHVIYYNRDHDYELRKQSEDRTHRIGSEIHDRIQYYDIYTKNTVEESALLNVQNKASVIFRAMPKKSALKLLYPSTHS